MYNSQVRQTSLTRLRGFFFILSSWLFFRYEQVERRAIWYFNNNKEEENSSKQLLGWFLSAWTATYNCFLLSLGCNFFSFSGLLCSFQQLLVLRLVICLPDTSSVAHLSLSMSWCYVLSNFFWDSSIQFCYLYFVCRFLSSSAVIKTIICFLDYQSNKTEVIFAN